MVWRKIIRDQEVLILTIHIGIFGEFKPPQGLRAEDVAGTGSVKHANDAPWRLSFTLHVQFKNALH
ncbi:hypothetical protein KIN20_002798 [Parelaphostrongylus tenuis]|uniref:Uncharacterized protein n=1 Tax=Parelaphostrongylus tenuis TaxID=148309 RepID=A0AAD5MHC0_PARTN|nr:hypothetical protein KIN20_002798 [Parelaphostrongylus tenuis]